MKGSDKTRPEIEVMDTAADDATLPAALAGSAAELPEVERGIYELGGELARGGMGRILLARDRRLDRPVAVKELLFDEPTLAARFEREALLTARLQHPSIVPVYEAGRWPSGEPFYTMKKVDGRPLDRLIDEAEGVADRLALLANIISVAEAIAYAHSRRIIHRDLKPANVLVGSFGETVVIDWGLAKELDAADVLEGRPEPGGSGDGATLTAYGAVLGTPAYMPPEQARGEPVDERADVYALGAILYHTLSGRPTFTGKSSEEVLAMVLSESPVPLAELDPDIPSDLVSIVDKAMAGDPEERYPDGGALADELRRFRDGQLVGAHQYTPWALAGRWVRRHRAAVMIAAAALVVLAISIGVAIARVRAEAAQARTSFANLLEEQGRLELIARRPLRAMTYLREAVRQSAEVDAAMATMLRRAAGPTLAIEQMLERHAGPITSLAISADGSTLWTAGQDAVIHIWDLRAARHLREVVLGAPENIRSMVLGPDDRRLAVVTEVSATLRDAGTGERIAALNPPRSFADSVRVAFSPDGSRLVVTGLAEYAFVLDSESGRRVGQLSGHEGRINAAAFSPDGGAIITAASDATARIWDAATFRERAVLQHDSPFNPDKPHRVIDARLRSDGARAITATSYGIAVLWDVATATEIRRFQAPGISEVAFARDESQILTRSTSVSVWSQGSDEPLAVLTNPDNWVRAMVPSRDGSLLAVAGDLGSQLVWNTGDWSLAGSLDRGREAINAAGFAPDGRLIAAGDDWRVVIWRPALGGLLRTFPAAGGGPLVAAQLDRSRTRAVLASRSGVAVWDLANAAPAVSIDVAALGARLDPTGERIVVLPRGSQHYRLYDAASGAEIAALGPPPNEAPQEPHKIHRILGIGNLPVSFSPSTSAVAAVLPGGGAHVWDSRTGEHQMTVGRARFDAVAVQYSPDGRLLAVSDDSVITLWESGSYRRRWTSEPAAAPPSRLVFSPDSATLVVLDERGSAEVRGVDGSLRYRLEGIHRSGIHDAAFAEVDGRPLLILASADHGASVWNLESGALRFRLEGHAAAVVTVDVDPGQDRIATSSLDGSARIWDIRTGRQIAELRGIADTTSQAAYFNRDGTALLTSLGDAAAMWDVAPVAPPREAILGADTFWRLEDGHLVRDSRRAGRRSGRR